MSQARSVSLSNPKSAAPPPFQVMIKPRGPICNLDCEYCYYLSKERLYPGGRFRMGDELLEECTRQHIVAQCVPEVVFAWQGGEPTFMGLDFFRRALELQDLYKPAGMRVYNSLQTNGILVDDEWCRFFKKHGFLIGVSLDGPQELHDTCRVDRIGRPTFGRVMIGLERIKRHAVELNVLASVHAANVEHPLEVYRFLRDQVGARFIQFIPIVQRDNQTGFQEGNRVTGCSLTGRQYGDFLISIFDAWVRRDVGRVFVQIFDVALAAWMGERPGLCVFEETCGTALAIEHNGDLYSCDHFVEPRYKLGNIRSVPLVEMVGSEQQRQFGLGKRDTLPRYCLDCEVRFVCNGGCPKNRFIRSPDNEPGLNYLCEGYRAFFTHIDRSMRIMAGELQAGRPATNIMHYLAADS